MKRELDNTKGYKNPSVVAEEKKLLKKTTQICESTTQKKGLGYLCEKTVDTENSIITGVDCFGSNCRESGIKAFIKAAGGAGTENKTSYS